MSPYRASSNHPFNGRMWLGEKRLKLAADNGLRFGRIVEMAAAWNGDCFQVGRVRRDAEGTPGDDFIVIGLYHAYRCAQLSKFPAALRNQRKQPPIGPDAGKHLQRVSYFDAVCLRYFPQRITGRILVPRGPETRG